MADINQPEASDVLNISPNSHLADLAEAALAACIGLAGDYIYARVTRYALPCATLWGALTRMWAAMAAALALNGTYPDIEDDKESNKLQALVDKWIDALNAADSLARDDAGNAVPLMLRTASSLPLSSTTGVLPLFYRPPHEKIIGAADGELNQDTAVTGIVEVTGKDNY